MVSPPRLVADVADDGADLAHGVLAAKEEHHHAPALVGLGVGVEVVDDVFADQLLDAAILRVVGGDDDLGVFPDQFRAGGEQAGGDEFEAGAADQAREDAPRARLVQGIGRDEDVGELLGHEKGD